MSKIMPNPYIRSTSTGKDEYNPIEKQYELRYNEHHEVEKVEVGEVDISKEINSHFEEVGLLNVVRMAIARGEDPLVKFAKTGPGIPVPIDPNITFDELNEEIKKQSQQYEEIAKTLGVSVDELRKAVAKGNLDSLFNKNEDSKGDSKDGGDL